MSAKPPPNLKPGDPYCRVCGYPLATLVETNACPECGTPLVDGLTRVGMMLGNGRRYTSPARVLGMPVLSIAFGPNGAETYGRARGFIALGDAATGVVAVGGRAIGLVAVGGMAMGGFTLGGLSMGLGAAMGGCAIGGLAFGGMAVGGIAKGGGAVGVVADGGAAIGYWARGQGAVGAHTVSGSNADPAAVNVFAALAPALGSPRQFLVTPMLILSTMTMVVLCAMGIAAWAHARHDRAGSVRAGTDRFGSSPCEAGVRRGEGWR